METTEYLKKLMDVYTKYLKDSGDYRKNQTDSGIVNIRGRVADWIQNCLDRKAQL